MDWKRNSWETPGNRGIKVEKVERVDSDGEIWFYQSVSSLLFPPYLSPEVHWLSKVQA